MSKRYELTLKATYLPNWNLFSCVREIIQNAKDSEVQYSAPMTVKFSTCIRNKKKTGLLIVKNEGIILPKETLLIGHTTKLGDERLIGKFGEGLKVGILALLRLGIDIKIKNGLEIWIPKIASSNTYNADVLVFDVSKSKNPINDVVFEITGINSVDWQDIKKKLLFIEEYPKEHIELNNGNILTGSEYKGMVFVKGMFVSFNSNYNFGYDFKHADIDRDRRIINCLNNSTSDLLSKALDKGLLAEDILKLMLSSSEEAGHISSWMLTKVGSDALTTEFVKLNPGIIPVETNDQLIELEMYGKKGIQVSWNLRNILEKSLGTTSDKIVEFRKSCLAEYTIEELTTEERDVYRFVLTTVARAASKIGDAKLNSDNVRIVDFTKPELQGTYNFDTGIINLARKIMNNKAMALYTLIHEAAHAHGHDGVREHENTIGKLTVKIFEEFLK
jgi:hypothetical protein